MRGAAEEAAVIMMDDVCVCMDSIHAASVSDAVH